MQQRVANDDAARLVVVRRPRRFAILVQNAPAAQGAGLGTVLARKRFGAERWN
ncbi:MAG TPA: hypothetical protein VNF69_15130 [Burkholderiales bacterium]|nr:hypothetical protein [Burkholderiales bacterium]